jgi:hypothetical protein
VLLDAAGVPVVLAAAAAPAVLAQKQLLLL